MARGRYVGSTVRGRGRVPRRGTSWTGFQTGTAFQALAGSTIVLDALFTPLLPEQTIVRIRGILAVKSDQEAADEDIHGAFGIALVEEPAASAGVTAVPSPVTDISNEAWILWQPFVSSFVFTSAAGFESPAGREYVLDSKAMRKISDTQRLVMLLENTSATGMEYWYVLRFLSLLKS